MSLQRLTFPIVLLKISPLVARLISVSLEELHEVLQLSFGWSDEPFYSFFIHGQEIGQRRHLRTRLLREFRLRRREILYTYNFLDLWEWEIRLLDIEAEADWRPALPGRPCGDAAGGL